MAVLHYSTLLHGAISLMPLKASLILCRLLSLLALSAAVLSLLSLSAGLTALILFFGYQLRI